MREVAPESPYELSTVSAGLDRAVGSRRFNLWLIAAFAAAALGLAMLGVYGLVAYAVSQRSREMGIRVALGAEPASLVRLVLARAPGSRSSARSWGWGWRCSASSAISGMLYGVTAVDPGVLLSVAVIMLAAAMAASYLPARRILKQAPASRSATSDVGGASQARNFPISHLWPDGSMTVPCSMRRIGRGPCVSCVCSRTGSFSVAPAATARRCTAIGSSTNSSIRTVVQPAEDGPRVPYSGDSVARKNGAPSISRPATTWPSPSRHETVAPNAAW